MVITNYYLILVHGILEGARRDCASPLDYRVAFAQGDAALFQAGYIKWLCFSKCI
jgi:hypothetical protein